MYFPTPKEAIGLLAVGRPDASPAAILLGKRITGPGGTAWAYKEIERGLQGRVSASLDRLRRLTEFVCEQNGIDAHLRQIENVPKEDLTTPWRSTFAGFATRYPMTDNLVRTKAAILQYEYDARLVANALAEMQVADASHRLHSAFGGADRTIDWVSRRMAHTPPDRCDDLFFPLRVVSLFGMIRMASEEMRKASGRGNILFVPVQNIFTARDPRSGQPAPFQPCMEALRDAAEVDSFDALFRVALDGSDATRLRDGRRYLAGNTLDAGGGGKARHPNGWRRASMLNRVADHGSLPMDRYAALLVMLEIAGLLASAHWHCLKLMRHFPDLDPVMPFDEMRDGATLRPLAA